MRMIIDGSKLYFATKRVISKYARLDFERLASLTTKEKIYYTTFNQANVGQDNFFQVLRSFGFRVIAESISGDEIYDFDSEIAFLLAKLDEPCLVVSNSKYLVPMIKRTNSKLCWFSDDLPAFTLIHIYRDKDVDFHDISQYVTYYTETR